MGVKATPAWPVDNFTPVKKMPMVRSPTHKSRGGVGDFSMIRSMVSATREIIVSISDLQIPQSPNSS
jgi:hypothetical protein